MILFKPGDWVCIADGNPNLESWGRLIKATTIHNHASWLIDFIDFKAAAYEYDLLVEGETNPLNGQKLINPHIPVSVKFIKGVV